MEIKNFIASIEVGRTQVDELDVRSAADKATCFIASDEGQVNSASFLVGVIL